MKLAGARALSFCERPDATIRAILLFGADPGLVDHAARTLLARWAPGIDPFNVARLSDEDLKRDPARLADELVARSLMGGDRVVRLRIEREAPSSPALSCLEAIEAGELTAEAFWIVEGGDLGRTSKLRSAFEAAKRAHALQLFPDDEATVSGLVSTRLEAAGVAIEPDALAEFCAELSGDRRLAVSEVEKLELFALDLGRPLTLADIRLVAAAEQPRGADDAADAAIAGDVVAADRAISRYLDAGGSAISALRTLHFRLMRIADAQASGGASGARLRPPIFDREWPSFAAALKDWAPDRLHRAFAMVYEAELACKQAGAPAEAILRRLVLRVAARTL